MRPRGHRRRALPLRSTWQLVSAKLDAMEVTRPGLAELDQLSELAERLQQDPDTYVAYLSESRRAIERDIRDVPAWETLLTSAWDGRRLAGWILPEVDAEMGRVWWWGPFAVHGNWHEVADRVYAEARTALLEISQEELVADQRSKSIPAFAERHGFHREEGSVLLSLRPDNTLPGNGVVRDFDPSHAGGVAHLHDELFPGTHTPGDALVDGQNERRRLHVVILGGLVVGYVILEHQNDGSGYIDFLGVAPSHRGQGIGRALIETCCAAAFDEGARLVHLSVREGNVEARALYRAVGFTEDRVIIPFRKGFSLS